MIVILRTLCQPKSRSSSLARLREWKKGKGRELKCDVTLCEFPEHVSDGDGDWGEISQTLHNEALPFP